MCPDAETQDLLKRVARGEERASGELFSALYDELRAVAGRFMAGERRAHTLQPTELVHEVWFRSLGQGVSPGDESSEPIFESRQHFVRAVARAMHHVLVDHARARRRLKRGEAAPHAPLDAVLLSFEEASLDVLQLHDVIEKLRGMDAELSQLVELRYFAGLTIRETAEAMGVTTTMVERRWRVARMWLRNELA